MKIHSLGIQNFRILSSVTLEPHHRFNFISGANGAGKTSLLEAIYCLGSGHSFRTPRSTSLIQRGCEKFLIFTKFSLADGLQHQLGFEKDSRGKRVRLDMQEVKKASKIAKAFPVQPFTPSCHEILETGPRARRRFLDWGLFHVEPTYLAIWQKYRKVLAQRNAALRTKQSLASICSWDNAFIASGNQISELRGKYCTDISPIIDSTMQQLGLEYKVEIQYQPGWSRELTLEEALKVKISSDQLKGSTQCGPHRAELQLNIDGCPAASFLSRGEAKALAFALQFSQMQLAQTYNDESAVIIWDDMEAEFDEQRKLQFLRLISSLDYQVFVTTTVKNNPCPAFIGQHKWFHVEHGHVKEML